MNKYYKHRGNNIYYKLIKDRIYMRYFPYNWFLTTMLIESLESKMLHNKITEITEEEAFIEFL